MFFFPVPPVPEHRNDLPPYLATYDAFSPSEIDRINELAERMEARAATVGNENRVDPKYNRSRFRFLLPTPELRWIFEKLGYTAAVMNARAFNFDISGFDQPFYHITYPGEDRGFYDWHADTNGGEGATRKLSITMQLADPSEYEGGELELNPRGEPVTAPKTRGAVILFPSYSLHRVAPVTRGARRALVCWIVGPPFR